MSKIIFSLLKIIQLILIFIKQDKKIIKFNNMINRKLFKRGRNCRPLAGKGQKLELISLLKSNSLYFIIYIEKKR